MACGSCSGPKSVPYVRNGYPTIWAFGPFLDHEVVEDIEAYLLELDSE